MAGDVTCGLFRSLSRFQVQRERAAIHLRSHLKNRILVQKRGGGMFQTDGVAVTATAGVAVTATAGIRHYLFFTLRSEV